MGHAEGDRKRTVILRILKNHPNGLMTPQIAREARIYEPRLAYYHLKVLMDSGHVVRSRQPTPMVKGRIRSSAFYYRLTTEQEKRDNNVDSRTQSHQAAH
jgi:DNA-binding transcriptional ArsR family regulator